VVQAGLSAEQENANISSESWPEWWSSIESNNKRRAEHLSKKF